MVALTPPVCNFNLPAVHFELPDTNNAIQTLHDCTGENGLLVMFICNHCPYVQSILDKIIHDCRELINQGIGCVAISANDTTQYPADSFDNMQKLANEKAFPFPYLYDESQQVAQKYGAVCTPDFFGYNKDLQLQYRGRFDDSGRHGSHQSNRDLFHAMIQIGQTGQGPQNQIPSIGCSIKWR